MNVELSWVALSMRRILGRTASAFMAVTITAFLLASTLNSQEPQGTTLTGVVLDTAGRTVSNAHVVLRKEKPPVQVETDTDAAGRFTFRRVAAGAFVATASLGPLGSTAIALAVSEKGDQPFLKLVLKEHGVSTPPFTQRNKMQTMDFADKPDFSIAAVTDWTAAGGHGSDSSLRTSEALTRDAVNLKPGNPQPAATEKPTGRAHRAKGELDEKMGDPLSAVREFQEAARDEPSEDNYFAWGAELLLHRAIWQAKEVFDEGARLYPHSARMLTARGATLFAGAMYNEAALDLCHASDLNPESIEPYLFMGKIEVEAPNPLPCVVDKLARFVKIHPEDAPANYYYSMALLKQHGQASDPHVTERATALLTRATILDPKCADGYFQLGNLSAGQRRWEQAIDFYVKAIEANPDLSEAHYRLGVAYQRVGQVAKAKEEFQMHDSIAREQAAATQREREAVKQFVVILPKQTADQQTR